MSYKNLGSYVAESRNNFHGGYCTAYLMAHKVITPTSTTTNLYIHTITRFDGGSFLQTTPFEVSPDRAESLMRSTALNIPTS